MKEQRRYGLGRKKVSKTSRNHKKNRSAMDNMIMWNLIIENKKKITRTHVQCSLCKDTLK